MIGVSETRKSHLDINGYDDGFRRDANSEKSNSLTGYS